MAKAAKKSAPNKVAKTSKKVSPFKTRKRKVTDPKQNDTLTPPKKVSEAIDAFRECEEQAKHFMGEATIYKDKILDYSWDQYAQRMMNGLPKSFKVLGDESMVTYVVMDSSAGLTEEDVDQFAERWGEKAADALITNDYASIRFNKDVLEANYDAVVKALEKLPEEVLENLFKPMLMRARPGASEVAKKFTKGPEELREMLKMLKMKNYIR